MKTTGSITLLLRIWCLLLINSIYVNGRSQTLFKFKDDNGKFGLKDEKGNIVIPAKYTYIEGEVFNGPLIGVCEEYERCTYMKASGELLFPIRKNTTVGLYSQNRAPLKVKGKAGYIDSTGKLVIPQKFEYAGEFIEGIALAELKGLFGYIDLSGNWVIKPQFKFAQKMVNNHAAATMNDFPAEYGGWFVMNKNGEPVGQNRFHFLRNFSEGMIPFSKTENPRDVPIYGLWGFADTTGKIVIEAKYNWVGDFKNGKAEVLTLKKEKLYIDKTGKVISPLTTQTGTGSAKAQTKEVNNQTSGGFVELSQMSVKGKTELKSTEVSLFGIKLGMGEADFKKIIAGHKDWQLMSFPRDNGSMLFNVVHKTKAKDYDLFAVVIDKGMVKEFTIFSGISEQLEPFNRLMLALSDDNSSEIYTSFLGKPDDKTSYKSKDGSYSKDELIFNRGYLITITGDVIYNTKTGKLDPKKSSTFTFQQPGK